jgi:hypothetical protein
MTNFETVQKGEALALDGRATQKMPVRFQGWTNMEAKYSEEASFSNLGELLAFYQVESVEELMVLQDAKEYGFYAYALFEDLSKGGGTFSCYFYQDKPGTPYFLAAGSSADRVFFPGEDYDAQAEEARVEREEGEADQD